MFGIVLSSIASAFSEVSNVIGKNEVQVRAASIYTVGFLSVISSFLLMFATGIFRGDFVVSAASLPTLTIRICLEVLQAHIIMVAIVKADRGDFGLVRTLTIPLLLIVDFVLGYSISSAEVFGICVILSGMITLFFIERRSIKAPFLLLATALNAVITISLYKYDISHFNSVEAEQCIVMFAILVYFYARARMIGERPLSYLRRPAFFGMSVTGGLGDLTGSFAYALAPASVITTALRGSIMLFAILSGRFYFKEKRFGLKLAAFALILVGLLLLTR